MQTPQRIGHEIAVNDEGFFLNPHDWSEEIVPELAEREGIAELTPKHWEVIRFMRTAYEERGGAPSVRALSKESGIPVKELYALFPKGPAKVAARIAGVPKPVGCI